MQIDGSWHLWFGNEKVTLIAFIDDATSSILLGEFVDRESTKNLGELTQKYVKQYGRPVALYSDRGSTYKVNNGKNSRAEKTHYQRMLQELDIELIHARSPQAKGRVERLFETLQDRLIKELELEGITTLEAANAYLRNVYIPEHNERYAVQPLEKADFHRAIDGYNLSSIFCRKFERIIKNDYTIQFKDSWFQLEQSSEIFIRRGQRVTIYEHFDGTIDIMRGGTRLAFKRITKQSNKLKQQHKQRAEERVRKLVYHKPSIFHPWRSSGDCSDISKELKR